MRDEISKPKCLFFGKREIAKDQYSIDWKCFETKIGLAIRNLLKNNKRYHSVTKFLKIKNLRIGGSDFLRLVKEPLDHAGD